MRLLYVSPSLMPSRTANSIHVARMCEAMSVDGHDVTLVIARSTRSAKGLPEAVQSYYGVEFSRVRLCSFYARTDTGLNTRIAVRALLEAQRESSASDPPNAVITRNLYAAFLMRRRYRNRLIFETHQLAHGFRERLERAVLCTPGVHTVVISHKLRGLLRDRVRTDQPRVTVLPDAAPAGVNRLTERQKRSRRLRLLDDAQRMYSFFVGYVGHLYAGRGIEVIRALAERHPDIAFLVYGGNEAQILAYQSKNNLPNLMFMGHVSPLESVEAMGMMDVLIMPYQEKVSIGGRGDDDTARWMSPMKMFEYMAVGVPIIASRIPVLHEVLRNDGNCLMASPSDVDEWSACIERLRRDEGVREYIAANAHADYKRSYTWTHRSRAMLELLSE